MKKFMKVCAIIALVLVVLGFMLAVVAGTLTGKKTIKNVVESVTGGRIVVDFDFDDDDWGVFARESDNEIGEALGEAGTAIGESIGELGTSIGEGIQDSLGTDNEVHYEIEDYIDFDDRYAILNGDVEKYSLGNGVSELEIEAGGCRFEIKESEDDNFYVEAKDIKKFQGYVHNGTLHITGTIGAIKWNESSRCSITLYVPVAYYYDEVDIELGAGAMSIGDLAAGKVALEVGAGQIKAGNIIADTLDISVGMGEAVVDSVQVRKLEGDVGMGHLYLAGSVNEKADVECSMGSLEMVIDGAQSDFDYDVECGMGSIDIGSSSFSSIAQERHIDNGASKKMTVECAMGDVEISFTE